MPLERVLVEVEGDIKWCARHWDVMLGGICIAADSSEDTGHCQPVPLYVEAPDP